MAAEHKTWAVVVRWCDGYLERFKASAEPRFDSGLLWFEIGATNRHIPLRQVRWFSSNPASRE